MFNLDELQHELVTANRILANEGVVDALGHISVRHPDRPDRFFLSCSRSPQFVTAADIMEFDLDCNPIEQQGRPMYVERPIHGMIYRQRPDILSVVHNHAHEVIPYGLTGTKLRPVLHMAGGIGCDIPIWDIRDKFGDTNLLVTTLDQGADLARNLGEARVVLMRGHGCVVAGRSIKDAVATAIYLKINALLQSEAMRMGEVKFLSEGEIAQTAEVVVSQNSMARMWDYWRRRVGMAEYVPAS